MTETEFVQGVRSLRCPAGGIFHAYLTGSGTGIIQYRYATKGDGEGLAETRMNVVRALPEEVLEECRKLYLYGQGAKWDVGNRAFGEHAVGRPIAFYDIETSGNAGVCL